MSFEETRYCTSCGNPYKIVIPSKIKYDNTTGAKYHEYEQSDLENAPKECSKCSLGCGGMLWASMWIITLVLFCVDWPLGIAAGVITMGLLPLISKLE